MTVDGGDGYGGRIQAGDRQYHRMHDQTNGDTEATYEHYLHLPICLVFHSQDCLALFAQPFGAAFSDGL